MEHVKTDTIALGGCRPQRRRAGGERQTQMTLQDAFRNAGATTGARQRFRAATGVTRLDDAVAVSDQHSHQRRRDQDRRR